MCQDRENVYISESIGVMMSKFGKRFSELHEREEGKDGLHQCVYFMYEARNAK